MHVAGDLKDLGFLGLKEGRRKSHRGGEESRVGIAESPAGCGMGESDSRI